jgi:glutamate racemase
VAAAVEPLAARADLDVVVLACTHFPLLAPELAAAMPGARQVDGGAGIARRIAVLTRGQPWSDYAHADLAVFTGGAPSAGLMEALSRYGLEQVTSL